MTSERQTKARQVGEGGEKPRHMIRSSLTFEDSKETTETLNATDESYLHFLVEVCNQIA
jgi:hypothetical protein